VSPIRPERQHVIEAGYQRGLGRLASLDVAAYWKRSTDQQDNNNFFDTGIIFPTSLAEIDVRGAEARLVFPERRGFGGTLSLTTSRAISTPPFTGGLFLGQDAIDALTAGPFAIDHDQRLSVHGTAQWRPGRGTWLGTAVRYDSGLVANPSDPVEVAADPDFADLLPYVDLDGAIARVRPRTIVDLIGGWDLRRGGQRTWSVQLQVTNLTNRTALYNFQSVFVGTRVVQPRTVAVRVKRSF
jgi:TonB dependent receptor